jgi:NADPH2:quinone reductase
MKAHAIRVYETGGPEVLKWQTVELPDPGRGEVLLRHTAVGLNLADTYRRRGIYPIDLPDGMGNEAVGVVEAVGRGVTTVKKGDRVGYVGGMPNDAYAEYRVAKAAPLIRLPRAISDQQAAAVLLKGITAQYLIRDTYRVKKGDTILVHAAAGGVGLILCQWAKALGATVIGIVSTEAKAKTARRNGCRHPIVTKQASFAKKVRDLTKGEGVDAVFDSVGRDTWEESMKCLKRHGTMVSFGSASGKLEPVDVSATAGYGSPYMVRASLVNYTVTPEETNRRARDLFRAIARGDVKVRVNQKYRLKDAAKAQRDLEARKTTGSTVLVP